MSIDEYNADMKRIARDYSELGNSTNQYLRKLAIVDLLMVIVLSLLAILASTFAPMVGIPLLLWNAWVNIRDGKRIFKEMLIKRQELLEEIIHE